MRLAWLYLKSNDVNEASQKTCSTIKAYAESLGAHDKFNLTLTDTFVRLMAQRMKPGEQNWQSFIKNNPDIAHNALTVLGKHFSKDLLMSESARTSLIKPDIHPL